MHHDLLGDMAAVEQVLQFVLDGCLYHSSSTGNHLGLDEHLFVMRCAI